MQISVNHAKIFFSVQGNGPALVLLHPFPAHHEFWQPLVAHLAELFQLVMPDLRGHGQSEPGRADITMSQHAQDLAAVCDAAGAGRAIFAGVSIGGYILFEFWRRYRNRIAALILCDTRPQPDAPEARAARLKSADEVERSGAAAYIESMLPKLLGETTRAQRPDLVERARQMMSQSSAAAIAAILRGMAARPDSVSTLATIDVPSLVMVGEEDRLTPVADAQLMHRQIRGSQFHVVPAAGHFAPYEQPEAVAKILAPFLRGLRRQ